MLTPRCLTNFLITFSVLPLLLLLSSCNFITNKILTKPVAQVETLQLTAQDFSKELANKLKDLDALSAKDPKIIAFFKEQIVNDFVVAAFVSLWFAENKLSLSAAEIDKVVALIVSTYPSDADFRELLSESGLRYTEWVAKIATGLKKKKLVSLISKDQSKLSEAELLSFYNNNRANYEQSESLLLSHIQVSDLSEAEVVKKILTPQNFTDVAKKYSSAFNLESKDLYGWIEKGYSPEFERAFKLRVGESFGPVALSGGIHLFKVSKRRPFKILSFGEVRPQVLTEVMTLRETAKFKAWLDVQIKKYTVKKNMAMIDSVRIETR